LEVELRHKVYVTISTYSQGQLVRETSQNSGRKKIDEVYIHINADTDTDYDNHCLINVDPGLTEVRMSISGGVGYTLDLASFRGRIILSREQIRNIVAKAIADELPRIRPP
jgi:hypothetical protein